MCYSAKYVQIGNMMSNCVQDATEYDNFDGESTESTQHFDGNSQRFEEIFWSSWIELNSYNCINDWNWIWIKSNEILFLFLKQMLGFFQCHLIYFSNASFSATLLKHVLTVHRDTTITKTMSIIYVWQQETHLSNQVRQ